MAHPAPRNIARDRQLSVDLPFRRKRSCDRNIRNRPIPNKPNPCPGSGKLKGMKAVITGGDSGIGRAVTIAFSREGADVLVAQPAELATAYVMLADPLSSFTSGTTVAVTGGKPFI